MHLPRPALAILALTACNSAPDGLAISVGPDGANTTQDLTLTFDADAVDEQGHEVTYEIVWVVGDAQVPAVDGATTVSADLTTRGETWIARVTAVDSKGKAADPVEASITIANSAPAVRNPALSPSDPTTLTDLTITFDTSDPDDDDVSASISWTVDGAAAGGDSTTLEASAFSLGQEVVATIVGNDGDLDSEPASASITIGNAPPTAPTVALSPSRSAGVTDDLVCTVSGAEDPDGSTLTYTYEWLQDGAVVLTEPGTEPTATLPFTHTAPGDGWTCRVAANDGTDSGPTGLSNEVAITAGPPLTLGTCGHFSFRPPPDEDCLSANADNPWLEQLSFDAGVQTWTIPASGTYRIDAYGAQGGGGSGGLGAQVAADFVLDGGDELHIIVGHPGGLTSQGDAYCGGGGGATWVYLSATDELPLLVAAGGGGQSEYEYGRSAFGGDGSATVDPTPGNGTGSGDGGIDGNGGAGGINVNRYSTGGGGAGWLTDGEDGLQLRNPKGLGGGAPRNGALGGEFTHNSGFRNAHGGFGGGGGASDNTGAGGGGGGYNGGGGGNNYVGSGMWGSGGGGGSYHAGTNPTAVSGVREGAGTVTITWVD